MTLPEYIEKTTKLYQVLLDFIENESIDDNEILYLELLQNFQIINQRKSPNDLKMILSLIFHISSNHQRNHFFIEKIEKILISLKEQIKQTLSNSELFNLFSNSKLILDLLFKNDMITIDKSIANFLLTKEDFNLYFYYDIKPFLNENQQNSIEQELLSKNPNIFKIFNEKGKLYDNDSYVCSLIRQDLIDEFIIYVNQSMIQLSSSIKSSIFETNEFLLKNKNVTLIEYAAFYGSIQIFQFLRLNNVDLSPSLWLYAIHSKNEELFNLLEENNVFLSDNSCHECLLESIKCHHNDFANYIMDNLLPKYNCKIIENQYYDFIFHYYNFSFFPSFDNEFINEIFPNYIFYDLFLYDYFDIVSFYIEMKKSEFETKIKIFIFLFLNNI